MPLHSPVVFPLFPILETAKGPKCACGDTNCERIGKHPAIAWGDLAYGDAVPRPSPGAGVGLKTGAAPKGSGVFVVDLDGPEAMDHWTRLRLASAEPLQTYMVESPRGAHLYFAHPGFRVKNSAGKLAPGIDIRGDGGFVVAAGSPHKSGAKYEILVDVDPAPAPAWLLDCLRAEPAPTEAQHYPGDVTDGPEYDHRCRIYTKYLREEATPRGPAHRGKGDAILFDVVQRGAYDLQLPTATVLDLVREHYDPRCSPQWGPQLPERVHHKARCAKEESTRPRVEPAPAALAGIFAPVVLDPPPLPPPRKREEGVREDGMYWDDWDLPVEPPRYLIDGLIPVATVGMLVAHGSSLKTWTALSLGTAIAKGEAWLDKFATRRGRVLVVDYESGLYELRRRIFLLEGSKVEGLGAWPYPDLRIDDAKFWERIGRIQGLGLVIVDSLAAGAPGVDENDTAAANPLKMAARFTEASDAAVMFIHHSKKDDGGDARKAVRGSTAIFADLDWCYQFENVEETPNFRRMHMVCIKPCMGRKPMPVPIELTDDGMALFDSGQGAPLVKDAADHEVQARIRLALADRPLETVAKIAKVIGMRRDRVSAEVDVLVTRRELAKVQGIGYVLNTPEALRARVSKLVTDFPRWRSESAIARAAGTDSEAIREIIREGLIVRSADGVWLCRDASNTISKDITHGGPERDRGPASGPRTARDRDEEIL